MATNKTIRKIVQGFDRIDAYLDNIAEGDAQQILARVNKLIKRFEIPATKNSSDVRSATPPSTKTVAASKATTKSPTAKKDTKTMAKTSAPALSNSEIKAYAEDHGMTFKKGTDKAEAVAAHQKHFAALIKKGADKLVALGEKNIEGFKINGRIKKEESRAKAAADLILSSGFVPDGRTIVEASSAAPAKKTSSKTEAKASSSKEKVKEKSSKKRSRDEDDEDDEDEAPAKSKKSSVKEKTSAKAEKTSTKKKSKAKDEDEAPAKKKSKKVVKDEAPAKKSKKSKR